MPRVPRPTASMLVALLALVLALAGGAAAQLSGPGDAINGCVGARGVLRVVAAGTPCESGEQAIDWSRQGPAGPAGPAGPQGASEIQAVAPGSPTKPPATLNKPVDKPGVASTQKVDKLTQIDVITRSRKLVTGLPTIIAKNVAPIGTLVLPKGRWLVHTRLTASLLFNPLETQATAPEVKCVVRALDVQDTLDDFLVPRDATVAVSHTLATQSVVKLDAPGLVQLRCVASLGTKLENVRMTALRVGAISSGLLTP